MEDSALITLLNRLLEAERAGAKVLAAFLDEYDPASDAWHKLREVQRDESKNCVILMDLITRSGGTPSHATGDFLEKALAIEGRLERLKFLNRGQAWVVRKIGEVLPDLAPGPLHDALAEMHRSHESNIAACDLLCA
ncbi:MAG: 2-nitropropane dioxygenase [Pseudomonadota bacterium]|nr:2-nitropropane dioxygenase [Pseudomonadota bacterium]